MVQQQSMKSTNRAAWTDPGIGSVWAESGEMEEVLWDLRLPLSEN